MSTSDAATLRDYFAGIARYSTDLLDRLPIPARIQPIAQTFATLKPVIDAWRPAEVARLDAMARPAPRRRSPDDPVAGMNTVGILADRLTILVCKEWYLRHRQRAPERADEIRREQIPDIVTCLSMVRPGHPRLLEKVGKLDVDTVATGFGDAYYGLLAANVLMWETQEMLYTRDMEAVTAEELRDYIRFFSQANMMRNAYITQAEILYWKDI